MTYNFTLKAYFTTFIDVKHFVISES